MVFCNFAVHSVGLSASRSRESNDGSERVVGQHNSRYTFISWLLLMFNLNLIGELVILLCILTLFCTLSTGSLFM